jgi:septum formation protein
MIILASRSTARKAMLERAGVEFAVMPSPYDEERAKKENPGHDPMHLAQYLACGKAEALSALEPQAMVIGADQTLTCNGALYGKPADRDDARRQLRSLRGKTHVLRSAVSCALGGITLWEHAEDAEITFRDFSDTYLEDYLDKGKDSILVSVGAYLYEGTGIGLMDSVKGSDHVILGMPLLPLLSFLRLRRMLAS